MLVAAHDVAEELERRVLAGLIGRAGHVAIQDNGRSGTEGLDPLHDRARHELLDATAGIGFHVLD
jgi:hypothetical protein